MEETREALIKASARVEALQRQKEELKERIRQLLETLKKDVNTH